MKKLFFALLLSVVVFVSGCIAEGLIGNLPAIDDPNNAAEVHVIREKESWGGNRDSRAFGVYLDQNYLFGIRHGKYTKFLVPSGEYAIGVKVPRTPASRSRVKFEPQKKYYFKMRYASLSSPTLQPMEEKEALELLKKTVYMPIDGKLPGGVAD